MEDLTVFVDDEEIAETAALLEPDLVYRGSKMGATLWLSLVGIAAGAFAAVTFSSGIRSSLLAFAAYLLAAFVITAGLRPATQRFVGRPIVWPAKTTFFWSAMLAVIAVLCGGFASPWLAYGLSAAGGFFIGMMHGSLNPNCIKNEDAWMSASLPLGIAGAVLGTFLDRCLAEGSVTSAAIAGGAAAGTLAVPASVLLFRLWDEAHGARQLAMLFLHNDNFAPKAVSYLDHALALSPDDADLYNLRGVAWSKMDEPQRAAEDWRRAAELRPEDAEPHLNLGVDHLRHGRLEEAIAAFHAALERDPKDATVYSNLGAALERNGEFDQAIMQYDKAIDLRPDYANAFSNRGYARLRKGDAAGSVLDCETALNLNPQLAPALVNRGHALAALGDRDAAADSYRQAVELGNPEIRQEAFDGLQALQQAEIRAAG